MRNLHISLLMFYWCLCMPATAQVQFTIERLTNCNTYQVSLTPDINYSVPFNLTNAAQVTLVVPTGTIIPTTVTSQNGNWGFVNPRITSPIENPTKDYLNFQLVSPATTINYLAGVEIPLFSFANAGTCTGPVTLFDNTSDPFLPINSINVNVGNAITILGAAGNAYNGNYTSGAADCCSTTTGSGAPAVSCLIEYVLEEVAPNKYQVSLIPDTTWTGISSITSSAQVSIRVPTGGFVIGNLQNLINPGTATEVFWTQNSGYIAPSESPNWDYHSFGLNNLTLHIPYQKGVKVPLFSFTNEGICTASQLYLVDNDSDPFMYPNSQSANVEQQITISGWRMADTPICTNSETSAACCDCDNTENTPPTAPDCLIEYVLEQIGADSFQVSLIPDTTWVGIDAITANAQVSVRVPTGGFIIGNLENSIDQGLATEVFWLENSRYYAPTETPNWDYYSFGLVNFTDNIPYQKGIKVPLFTFTNVGICTADSIFLIDNLTDPLMQPNSVAANIEQQITVSGWRMGDVPVCIGAGTTAACCDCSDTPIIENPQPSFSANTACANSPTFFTEHAVSTNTISRVWNFGDGVGVSTIQNPSYIYTSPGTYSVTLTVKFNNGQERVTANSITICAAPGGGGSTSATPAFSASTTCLQAATLFTNTTNPTNVIRWHWDFGDGNGTSDLLNPTHIYGSDGTFPVTLTAFYNDNTQQSITKNSTVLPMVWPLVRTSKDSICVGDCVRLQAQGGTTYNWSAGSTLDDPTFFSPVACPTTTTTYTVTITNANNCSAVGEVTIYVGNFATVSTIEDVTICRGDSIPLGATASGDYQWSPVGFLGNSTLSNPIAFPTSTTEFCVTTTDANGCTAKDCMTVTVVDELAANAGADVAMCAGNPVTLSASGGTSYQWSPTTGLSNANIANPIATPTATTTYCVIVTDASGCTGTDCMEVKVGNLVGGINGTVAICTGGTAQLNATGGSTYSWSPTTNLSNIAIPNPLASPIATTEYCVTITDATGCTDRKCTTVTVSNSLTANAGNNVTICQGQNTTLVASGGSTYQWSPTTGLSNANISNPIATPTTTTTYCVTISDGNGCTDSDCIIVTVGNTFSANAGTDLTLCAGDNTTLSASGGTQYQWSPTIGLSNSTVSNPVATPTATTTYCVTVSDVNGCSAVDCVNIIVGNTLTASAGNDATICLGNTTQLFASGGNSYTWSPTQGLSNATVNNPIATPSTTTTYCVTVTNNDNCIATDCVNITVGNTVNANAGRDASICSGGTTQLLASGGSSYQWSPSVGLSNANNSNPIATPSNTTTYCVTVSDANGCSDVDCMTLTVGNNLSANAGNDTQICVGGTTQLNAIGGNTYRWSPATGLSNAAISNPIATPTSTTTYCVTVSDASGCSAVDCVLVSIGNSLTANAGGDSNICVGESTRLIASGGSTYNWRPTTGLSNASVSNPTATPSITTTYCVTVSDANGCSDVDCALVTVGNTLTANAGNNINICTNSSIQLNATGGSTYRWSPTTGLSNTAISNPIANPSTTTTYCVTVSDANGCSDVDCVILSVGNNITANAGNDASICSNASTQLSASGGNSYRWSPTAGLSNTTIPNPIATPSTTTTYCVTVTDANGCSDVDCVIITIDNSITANAGSDASLCANASTQLNATGGTIYRWGPAAGLSNTSISNPIATPSTTTTYCVTVSDANGCSDVDCVIVNIGNSLSANAGPDASICTNGSTQLNATGGSNYRWSPTAGLSSTSSSNPIANPSTTTTYCVTVSDANGCSGVDCVIVTVGNSLSANAGPDASICTNGSTQLNATGGSNYRWSPTAGLSSTSSSNPIANPSTTTTYCVTVSDATGCSDIDCVVVTVGNSINVNAGNDRSICAGNATQLTASGGTSYRWSPTAGLNTTTISNPTATPSTTTTYCVTVSDGNGCTGVDCVIVNVATNLTANAGNDVSICGNNTTTLNASGGSTYQWSPADGLNSTTISNPNVSPTSTTTYCVTVSNGSGCTAVDCVIVNVDNSLNANAGQDATICAGSSASLNATGGSTYRWSPTAGLSSSTIRNPIAAPSTSTTYCVTVSDGNGCTDVDCVVVNIGNSLNANAGNDISLCTNGSTILNATGGTTYQWSPATGLSTTTSNNPTATPTSTTTYCVTVSDANGCTGVDCVTVTIGNNITANAGSDASICEGGATTLNATGGNIYRWSPTAGLSSANIRNPTAAPRTTTTYCVTVSDANGCTDVDCVLVGVGDNLNANAGTDVSVCANSTTQLNATGGTSYQWSPTTGLSNATIPNPTVTPTSSATYCVTVTGANGCTGTDCMVVSVENASTASAGNDVSICSGTSTTLNASGGTTYQWIPTTGLNNALVRNPVASPLATTTYCVTVVNAKGCTDVDCVTVTVVNTLNASAGTDISICKGSSTALNATGGTSYQWSPTIGLSNPSIRNPIASPVRTTTYCVTVTDRNNPNNVCAGIDCITVNIGENLSASAGSDAVICPNSSTQLNATGGISYNWFPSTGLSNARIANPIAQPDIPTNYCVTITDATGCTGTDCVNVSISSLLSVSAGADQISCGNTPVQLNASGGTTYQWAPRTGLNDPFIATPFANPSTNTRYCVTVTDATGCIGTDCVNVTTGSTLPADAGVDVAICSGSSTQLQASGGSSYRWSPVEGLSDPTIANPVVSINYSSLYCVTITDAVGCTSEDCVTVSVLKLHGTAGTNLELCQGESVQLNASGGVNYQWTPSRGLSNPNISNPFANPTVNTIYCVTFSADGCSETDCIEITIDESCTGGDDNGNTPVFPCTDGIIATACPDKNICLGGTAQLSVNGGTNWLWTPVTGLNNQFSVAPLASPTTTTTYSVTVTDERGCTDVDQVIVVVNSNCNGDSSQSCTDRISAIACEDKSICPGENIQLTVTTGAFYQWIPTNSLDNPFIGIPVASPLTTTTYFVTVTDDNGCTGTDQVTVYIKANCDDGGTPQPCATPPTVVACEDKFICQGGNTRLTVTTGASYSWSPATSLDDAFVGAPLANPTSTTTYTVTVTDANGCTGTDQVIIYVNKVNASAGIDQRSCGGIAAQLTASGGIHYQWSPIQGLSNPSISNPTATPLSTTTYCVTITDVSGCIGTDCVEVAVSNSFPAVACEDKFICLGGNVRLTVTTGKSYQWSPFTGLSNASIATPIASPLQTTIYTVTVIDEAGCHTTDQVVVNVDPTCTGGKACPEDILPTAGFTIALERCDLLGELCLPLELANIADYTIMVNDQKITTSELQGCQVNYAFAYTYFTVPDRGARGPYELTNWTVNGKNYTSTFNTIEALVNFLNEIDPIGFWVQDATTLTIKGGNNTNQYGLMAIKQTATNASASLELNVNISPSETMLVLPVGVNEVSIIQQSTGCEATATIEVSCPEVGITTYLARTIAETEQGQYCFSLPEDGTAIHISNICPEISGERVVFTINNSTQCLHFEGIQAGNETACMVHCDEKGVCDTTYVTVSVLPLSGLTPEAGEDASQTIVNEAVEIDVISNDRSIVDIQTIEVTSIPTKGKVTINEDQTITYLPSPDYCNTQQMDYFTYTICNDYGCDSAQVKVMVACEPIKVYSGFSPNQDNINDYFRIGGLNQYPNNQLQIFNRWGTLVFQQKGYDNTWDGTYKNAALPDGVYFYRLDTGQEQLSGFIQINR